MPTHQKTRFANKTNTGKNTRQTTTRGTRFSPKNTTKVPLPRELAGMTRKQARALANAFETPEPDKAPAKKKRKRWASDTHIAAANQINRGRRGKNSQDAEDPGPVKVGRKRVVSTVSNTRDEELRRVMIRDRNRRRRTPWIPAAGTVAVGLLGQGATHLYAVASVPVETTSGIIAGIPAAAAIAVGLTVERRYRARARVSDNPLAPTHRAWLPEIALAGVGSSAIVYWIAVAGMSWWIVLVILVATVAGGSRWWKANPIGPNVRRLEVSRPEPIPQPEPEPEKPVKVVPPPETDPYCIAWQENNASGDGKAKKSRLTNRRDDEFTITYDVELKRGAQSLKDLLANREPLAGGLGEDTDRVLFKRAPRGAGANKAVVTIIVKDPVAETRFYTGPQVEDGVIKRVARFIDGRGEIDIVMWDDGGMVCTMVVGSTGGGKSGAANILTCGALSTGVMNLLYADPKGNSSTALASRARVAIIGKQNVLKLPMLITAILAARGKLAAELGADQIFPSKDIPGWMFLHDEYSLIANDPVAQKVWTETVNIVRAYGIWAVALNQSQGQPQWGNDHARSAFASQVIAFRVNSKSGSDLVPGLNFDPNELPVDEKGRPVPGMAVHAHYDTPTRWDFLPSEANAQRMEEKGEPAPPYTTTEAFDEFFNQPELHPLDELAITAVLGPAVNGRWQVGGRGSTHEFPELDAAQQGGPAAPNRPKGRWGQRGATKSAELSPAQAEVLSIVRDGTTETGEIVAAAQAAESTVKEALTVLVNRGLLRKSKHGVYEPATTGA